MTSVDSPVPYARLGRATAISIGMLYLVSIVVIVFALPDGIRSSADPGTPRTPLWMPLLPAATALVIIHLVPRGIPRLAPELVDRPAAVRQVIYLLLCATAFPLVVGLADISGSELYLLAKLVILIAIPAIIVWRMRRAIRTPGITHAWQWWAPAIAVLAFTLLSQAPWVARAGFGGVDPVLLVIVALFTLLTAGFGEEFFYRMWLQTRLEALIGRWGGIAVATLAFSLMHLGGDRQGAGPIVEAAAAIVVQGSFGLVVACLWSRYRNIWLAIIAHALLNGWPVVEHFIRG